MVIPALVPFQYYLIVCNSRTTSHFVEVWLNRRPQRHLHLNLQRAPVAPRALHAAVGKADCITAPHNDME